MVPNERDKRFPPAQRIPLIPRRAGQIKGFNLQTERALCHELACICPQDTYLGFCWCIEVVNRQSRNKSIHSRFFFHTTNRKFAPRVQSFSCKGDIERAQLGSRFHKGTGACKEI